MLRTIIIAAAAMLSFAPPRAAAAPKPAISPASWQLDFQFDDPQRITVTLPGASQPTTYWYLIYTVTNNTKHEIDFYPTFYIVTGDLKVVEGGFDVSPTVFDSIRTRHTKAFPFSFDPMKMYGPMLQGEDNARTSIIVFPEFSMDVNRFTVFVGGLSGEIVKVRNFGFDRAKGESPDNPAFFHLRKTLAISYDLPGDPRTRLQAAAVRVKEEWVMR